jgi:hypothetical protein
MHELVDHAADDLGSQAEKETMASSRIAELRREQALDRLLIVADPRLGFEADRLALPCPQHQHWSS